MAIEHHFYMDATASRQALRDALVEAGIGLDADPDWKNTSGASSEATNVTILNDLSSFRPDNTVAPTRSITFRARNRYLSKPEFWWDFERQTVLGIMALLKTYPEADAYWLAYDAEIPMLLRRGGRLVLSQAQTVPGEFWDPERAPARGLVDLPYTVEPLGPWKYVRVKAQEPGHRPQPVAS